MTAPTEKSPSARNATYERAWSQFEKWCEANGRNSMPCSSDTLTSYTGHLIHDRGVSPASLRVYVSAIRARHPEAARPSVTDANRLIAAWKTERLAEGTQRQTAPILTEVELLALLATCIGDGLRGVRDMAVLTLALGLSAQAQQLVDLQVEEVEVTDEGVTVRSSTGLEGFASHVQHPLLDPVEAVRDWLAHLEDHGVTTGFAFPLVDAQGRLHEDVPSTRHSMRQIVQRRARSADLGGRGVTFQSLRVSSFHARGDTGFNEAVIAQQGLWLPPIPSSRYVV